MVQQPGAPGAPKKPILIITSQVVRGSISGRGLSFALERLGHDVWFLPTVLLPWHPGHGGGTRIMPPAEGFAALASDLANSPKLSEIGGIISGFLGSAEQAKPVAELIAAVKAHDPKVPYLCDPVIGDHQGARGAGLYVPEATAAAIRDTLVPMADIVTPNVFELGWLTGRELASELETLAAARALGADRVLVTSSPALRRNAIANLLAGPFGAVAAEHGAIPNPPHGTGDLMAGLFLARRLEGMNDEDALVRAAGSVFEMVARSVKKGADELMFAEEQQALLRPMALVSSRRVMESSARA